MIWKARLDKFLLWTNGKKTYLFCAAVLVAVPVIHFFGHRLKAEFMVFMEALFGYFICNRHSDEKTQNQIKFFNITRYIK